METYSTPYLTILERVAHYGQPINSVRVQQRPLPIINLNYVLQTLYIDSVGTQSAHVFQSSCESIIKSEKLKRIGHPMHLGHQREASKKNM